MQSGTREVGRAWMTQGLQGPIIRIFVFTPSDEKPLIGFKRSNDKVCLSLVLSSFD